MTHPPGGPITSPPPSGPRTPSAESTCPEVVPLDPDSPEGRQIAADLAQVLAEIEHQIQQREAAQPAA